MHYHCNFMPQIVGVYYLFNLFCIILESGYGTEVMSMAGYLTRKLTKGRLTDPSSGAVKPHFLRRHKRLAYFNYYHFRTILQSVLR